MQKDTRTLSCKIDKFFTELVAGKSKVFFELTVEFIYNKWTLRKRYSDFEDLHKSLKVTYTHLPALPGKSLFALKKDADIDKRRLGLDVYIKELVKKNDLYSDPNFAKFLEVSSNWMDSNFVSSRSTNQTQLPIRCKWLENFQMSILDSGM